MAAGAALPFVLRRFGPMGMIAAAAGGYAVKKYLEKRNVAGVDRTVARLRGASDTGPTQF